MKKVELNHWFIDDNKLNISLMRFYVEIKPLVKNHKNVFSLKIINSERNELLCFFKTLEEAVSFTEESINLCQDFNEVMDAYHNLKNPKGNNKILILSNKKK